MPFTREYTMLAMNRQAVGTVVASGGKAEIILSDSTISGGILRTSGASTYMSVIRAMTAADDNRQRR